MESETWLWSEDYRQLCRVIEPEQLWDKTYHRVWLVGKNVVVRIPDDSLKPLDAVEATTPSRVAMWPPPLASPTLSPPSWGAGGKLPKEIFLQTIVARQYRQQLQIDSVCAIILT